jgi:hypothetical protein
MSRLMSHRGRKSLALASVLIGASAVGPGSAAAEEACKENPRLVGQCFSVHGRLSVHANLRPYLSVRGSGRLIGIASLDGQIIMPAELVGKFEQSVDRQVSGDFEVCPFTRRRPGVMQLGCIAGAKHLTATEGKPIETATPSPSALRAEIAAHGARAVVGRLWKAPVETPGRAWLSVEEQVALGSDEWLGVAEALAPGTDAGTSHGLNIALHHALAKNPERVLTILARLPERTELVCSDGDDEQAAEPAARELRAALAAVGRVGAPELRAQRDQCLQALRGALTAVTVPAHRR